MRHARAAIAALTTLSLVGAMASIGGAAQAATNGVGTSQVSTTVANVQLGTNGALLGVRLLGDDARSTIDSKVASSAEAFSRLTGLAISSDTVTDLKTLSSPPVESKQPGGDASVTTGSVDLSNPGGGVTVPSSVLSGSIGLAHLSSEAATTQAKSALSATLTNASVGGALASVAGVTSGLNTAAVATQSDSSRSIKVDQVVVVDLGSLLDGIGLDLPDLGVDTLTALLTELNTTVNGLNGAAVNAIVDDLQDEITTLSAAVTLPGGTVATAVDTINDLGTTLGIGTIIDSTTEAVIANPALTVTQQINALVDELQAALSDLLGDVLTTLDGLALLKVDSVDVGVTTKAADTVANSVHTISGKIGAITVGNAALGTVDVTQALADVNAKVTEVNNEIKGVLNGVDPGLGDMVTISVFERANGYGLSEANGYVKAVDGITGLKASVTPPTTLSTIVAAIQAAPSAEDVIVANGGTVPTALSDAMGTLGTTLNNNATPLGNGATVTIASINSSSEFAPQLAGTNSGGGPGDDNDRSLAATGSNDAIPMTAMALLLIALGLGFREWIRMPVPMRARGDGRG